MTRHITDPEVALARAIDVSRKVAALMRPGMLRTAYEAGASLGKGVASKAQTIAGVANTVAGAGAGNYAAFGLPAISGLGSALGGVGSALAATPVGAGLAGLNAVYHLRAVYSTERHISALRALSLHASTMEGRAAWHTTDRTLLALSYALAQKAEKSLRRGASAVPGLGLLATAYGATRAIYKSYKGTKGTERTKQATAIVAGLKGSVEMAGDDMVIRPDYLAYGIALELLGEADFGYAVASEARDDWDRMVPILASKLKST